jgi:ribosomal protein S18 acetylase RimI-like enzyme
MAEQEVVVRRARPDEAAVLSGLRWRWNVLEARTPVLPRAEFDSVFSEWMRAHAATHLPFVGSIVSNSVSNSVSGNSEEAVGMAWLAVLPRVPDAAAPHRAGGDLQSVFIVPHLRGQGLGRRLVGAVAREAARLGLTHLTVRTGPSPRGFYLRLGFTVNGEALELNP